MLHLFKKAYEAFCFLISPPFCSYCKVWLNERKIFCSTCYANILPVISTKINISDELSVPVIAISDYKDQIKSLILAKHSKNILASISLGRLVYEKTVIKNLEFDVIVPIPLHWTRRFFRGYNQVESMAYEISKLTRKPVIKVLKRSKRTSFQAKLSRPEREQNLKNSFYLTSSNFITGKKILLIDDLMTTGATLKSAAKVLKKANPQNIICVVAARVV